MGRKKTLADITQYIIKYQSRVSFANEKSVLESYSLDDITDEYLRAYRLKKHNILKQGYDIGLPGMLCYDLMLCSNPYSNLLKQYFFTLFSLETVVKEKDFWARIYTYYLDNKPFVCIDTILQICYATPDIITDSGILKRITNNGLCLQLNNDPSPDDSIFYIKPNNTSLEIAKKVLESNQVSIINRKMCEFQQTENQQLIVECVDLLDDAVAAAISNTKLPENDSVSYREMIDAFLYDKHTSLQEYCNYIKILVINILSVPEMQYLYFISVTSRGNLQIGHYTYSSKIAASTYNLANLTVLSYVFIMSVVETNLAAISFRRIAEQKKQIQRESLKSAKAAIMSRNMSHNLGSHVMFYIKQKLQSVSKIVDNKVLANIIPGELSDLKTIEQKIKENKDVELPFLVGLGRFINYLQERQDYIATVATDYIPARSTISFKDFIYDELKPELRYQRHHSEGSSSDAGWQSGNLLLDYIAYSEQYRKSEDIKVCFGLFNGTNPITNSDADKDFQALRKFNIAVPGGVIGRQAIFSIFENIIRNAAKHSSRRKDGKMVIELSLLKEDEDKKFKLDNVDNLRCKREENGNEEKGQELLNKYTKYKDTYHVLRIKIDMPNKEEDIDNLVSKLGKRYVEADGSMVETSKGLKEMRISAAWLRGYSMDSEIPDDEPPVLSIYREPYEGSDYTLSYILCIPKPRKVAFVLKPEKFEEWKHLNNEIKSFGCEVFVVEDIDKYYEKKYKENDNIKQADTISNFEIVCMPSDYKNIICPSISSRYIADDGKIEEILTALDSYKGDEQKLKETIRGIYCIWFEATYPNSNSQLVIADEKAFKDKEAECKKLNEGKKDKVILKVASQMASKPDTSTQKTEDTKENEATKDDCSDNIVFSTHFKGLEYDKTDYGQMMTASTCIEPITGNNSTARLIRQDEWNEEWQYKLLSSGLAKVAIFDERIFSSFISRESKAKIDNLVNKIKEIKLNKPENTWKKEFIALGIEPGHAISLKTADEAKIQSIIEKTYDVKYWYEVAQKNHERRIYAFDIRNVSEKKVDIVGYNVNIGKQVGAYPKHEKNPEVTIAQVTYDGKDVKVELTDNGKEIFKVDDRFRNTNKDKGGVFDYITIHQGVLDKIYTAFGIKNDEDEKYKVTNALHQCFSKQDTPTEVKKFLPNFIIHSGRSKPSKNDMPQEQPFVQFAAVDHAVKDCKYTLVELLASAHYEK